jgi:hypothetical protein
MKLKRKSDIDNLSDLKQQDDSISFIAGYNQIALPLVRRQFPALFSNVLVGVKPQDHKKYNSPKLNPRRQKYIHR